MTKPATPHAPPNPSTPAPLTNGGSRVVLDEVEQTIEAARTGEIDTLIIRGPAGQRVFTLVGADQAYRDLLEAMSEGVAKLTAEGVIDYCNARFAAILGVPLEQMMSSSLHDYVRTEEGARLRELLSAGARTRSEGEFRLHSASTDSGVPVLLSVVPLTMYSALRQCVVMTDLTAQHRSNEAIAAERSALQTRLLLADRMLSMGTLAAGVAHEINNPLAYVIATIQLMIEHLPDLELGRAKPPGEYVGWLRTQLTRAHEGIERVRVIVRDLKAFSSADDETIGVVDVKRALDSSIALVSNDINHRARLVQDYTALPNIRGNEARLGQVFVNLLVNAADAIPLGAADRNEIRVSGYADGAGQAVIEIRDTGAGIAPKDLGRIFEPFFTTKPIGSGTGLGLALCHGIVDTLGGNITVESTPGAGTTFRVAIPAIASTDQAVVPVPRAADEPTLPGSRARLLVVDDEEDLCDTVRDSLERFHEVVTTTDARQALAWIEGGERFDLIVCDMRMPEMSGLDFHRCLVSSCPEQARRVTLMSGGYRRQPGDPLELPSPVLEKPFEMSRLNQLVRDAVKRWPTSA